MKKLHAFTFTIGLVFLPYLVWSTGMASVLRQLTLLGWGLLALVLSEGAAEMLHTLMALLAQRTASMLGVGSQSPI